MVAAVGLLTAACGGPLAPFDVGVQEVANDIVLGAPEPPPLPPPLPIAPLAPRFEQFDAPTVFMPSAPRRGTPPTTVLPIACPTASPSSAARIQAINAQPAPPTPATYEYRVKGKITSTGATSGTVDLPIVSTRTVGNFLPFAAGAFTYDISTQLGDVSTITTYRVIPEAPVAPVQDLQAGSQPGAIYIDRIVTNDRRNPKVRPTFDPNPDLKLLEFRALNGTNYRSSGTDGTTTMSFNATIGVNTRVDACGTLLDAIPVEVTQGVLAGPDGVAANFTATYVFAPQYGGLVVMDKLTMQTASSTGGVATTEMTSTINREPELPR